MPSVNPVTAPVNGADKTVATPVQNKKQLTPDDFIKLFMAQMLHQDPLHPMDNNQVLQEMASSSQIQASQSMEKTLQTVESHIESTMGQTQMLQATQLIGKNVEVQANHSPLVEGKGLDGSIGLPAAATNVVITVKGPTGNIVYEETHPTADRGVLDFHWDGKDKAGLPCEAGSYNISATGSINGVNGKLDTAGAFKVKSVALDSKANKVYFSLDSLDGGITTDDIIKFL